MSVSKKRKPQAWERLITYRQLRRTLLSVVDSDGSRSWATLIIGRFFVTREGEFLEGPDLKVLEHILMLAETSRQRSNVVTFTAAEGDPSDRKLRVTLPRLFDASVKLHSGTNYLHRVRLVDRYEITPEGVYTVTVDPWILSLWLEHDA